MAAVLLLVGYLSGALGGGGQASGVAAQASAAPKAYVGLFKDNAVAVLDTGTNRVLRSIPVPAGPHGLVITPDGKRVFVSSDGASTVSVIDTATDEVVGSVDVGPSPHGLAITPDGKHVLAAVFGGNQVVSIDTATDQIGARVYVSSPHNIAISPDGTSAYIAAQKLGATGLVVVDANTLTLLGNVPLEKTPRALSFSPDGKWLYYTLAGSDAVQVLDPATNMQVNEIPVGASPHLPTFTPQGDLGLVVVQGPGELALVNPTNNTAIGQVKVGTFPHWAATSPDGKTAYVTNETSGDVSVVDLAARAVTATIPVGNGPRKIVVQPGAGMPMGAQGGMAMGDTGYTPTAAPAPTSTGAGQVGTGAASVRIANFAFVQPALTVAPGTTVTWTNDDSVPHTVTSDDGTWQSGVMEPGAIYQHRFDQAGTFAYHCSLHPFMKATVVAQG